MLCNAPWDGCPRLIVPLVVDFNPSVIIVPQTAVYLADSLNDDGSETRAGCYLSGAEAVWKIGRVCLSHVFFKRPRPEHPVRSTRKHWSGNRLLLWRQQFSGRNGGGVWFSRVASWSFTVSQGDRPFGALSYEVLSLQQGVFGRTGTPLIQRGGLWLYPTQTMKIVCLWPLWFTHCCRQHVAVCLSAPNGSLLGGVDDDDHTQPRYPQRVMQYSCALFLFVIPAADRFRDLDFRKLQVNPLECLPTSES